MTECYINCKSRGARIGREIYGHFSEHLGRCIYGGLFVGKNSAIPNVNGIRSDVAQALRHIRIPVLRWPGGCFADEYHWQDGIGEAEHRKKMVNTHWGGVVEDNSFGTHEFFELCSQLGCEPYICGNVGSGTVAEMKEWVEYMTFDGVSPMASARAANGHEKPWKLKYFGVGNENWGCGGNMLPDYYANEYRRYQTYVRNYGDNRIFKIASGAYGDDYAWTDTLMRMAGGLMDGISLHYYTLPGDSWEQKGPATGFDESAYYTTLRKALRMKELVESHAKIMDRYDPQKRVALVVDEWGTWYDVEPGTNPGFLYQQNTMRDALVAAVTLDIFNRHCDRVRMANIAQTVNVLQAVILTEGGKMVLTPTYHVFDLYKCHQGATLLDCALDAGPVEEGVDVPALHSSASVDESGNVNLTLSNLSADQEAEVTLHYFGAEKTSFSGELLHGAINAHNTFDRPDDVKLEPFTDFCKGKDGVTVKLPPCSVLRLTAE